MRLFLPLLLGIFNCASPLNLDIVPKQFHGRSSENVTVMCKSDTPLKVCQFSWKNHWQNGPILDLKLGSVSAIHTSQDINGYWYTGNGLDQGDCGLTINVQRWGSRVIGCRVRADQEDWEYADMVIQIDSQKALPMNISDNKIVKRLGDKLTITCTANEPLKDCTFSFPGISLVRFNQGQHSSPYEGLVYAGSGLDRGECGVYIDRVTEAHNGRILCSGKPDRKREHEVLAVTLIVAQPPTQMDLAVEKNPIPIGENLKATCTVRESRPPPNITWYLGSEIIRSDHTYDFSGDQWVWQDTPRTVTQTLVRNVSSKDNGKELRCVVDHIGLSATILKSQYLSVRAPPTCEPLTSSSVDIFCIYNNEIVSCHERLRAGTMARLQCKIGFVLPTPQPDFTNVTCLDNGIWTNQVYSCLIDCGRRNTNDGETLIHGGYQAKIGEFPWHVAVYEKIGPDNYAHICGGSLITQKVVLSAAHCFWDNASGVKKNHTLYKIAAGQYYRGWNAVESLGVQNRDVIEIKVPERYKGRDSNFAQDIAQVYLTTLVTITARVSTICIDWGESQERFDLQEGRNGTVAGWGYTETGEQSDELKAVDLPFIPFSRCYNALPQLSKPILTEDKFCAGYANQSISVCRGDSGGGLVFYNSKTERYNIRGIVSVAFKSASNKDRCYAQLYTAFTQVSKFRAWLQQRRSS